MTPWTLAHQAPLCMAFPRQEYWSGLTFPSSGYLPNTGIKTASPLLAGAFFYHWATWEAWKDTSLSLNPKAGSSPTPNSLEQHPSLLDGERPVKDVNFMACSLPENGDLIRKGSTQFPGWSFNLGEGHGVQGRGVTPTDPVPFWHVLQSTSSMSWNRKR